MKIIFFLVGKSISSMMIILILTFAPQELNKYWINLIMKTTIEPLKNGGGCTI